jgi:sulfate adenylyltransferase
VPDSLTPPQWTPSHRERDDLDLLVNGALYPPLDGFADPRAAGDSAAITLIVDHQTADVAAAVGCLELVDPEGAPLAQLTVEAHYTAPDGRVGLVGPVTRLAHNDFGPFRRLHLPPRVLHERIDPERLLAVPIRRPLADSDLEAISRAAAGDGLTPLLIACVGDRFPDRMTGPGLVRTCLVAAELLGPDTQVVAASIADHGDEGPYGADDAWPSANAWLVASVSSAYAAVTLTLPRHPTGDLPAEVDQIVRGERPPRHRQGAVFFFTGLSGSGKSTLARALVDHILEQGERTITSLDGDVVRHHLSKGLGFSREDRETNITRIGFVAAEISRHGGLAICSPIAPFESTRQAVREMVEHAGGGFVLIHVSTPLEECERRDRKGLYARARRGEIADFTGISSPYEEPSNGFKIDTTNRDIAECLDELVAYLVTEGWLPH